MHIVGALVRRGLRDCALAHAAAHLLDGIILVFFHPPLQPIEHAANMAGPMRQERRRHHRHVRTGHQRLEHIFVRVHAAGHREVGLDRLVEYGDPAQAQAQLVRIAQLQVRHDSQIFQVDVRLVEAVEQHERICAGASQAVRHVREGREVRAKFDRDRDAHAGLDVTQQVEIGLLDLFAGRIRIGRDIVYVQFERVRACLFDLLSESSPAARREAVQTRNHGNANRGLHPANVLQIAIGPMIVVAQVREVCAPPALTPPPESKEKIQPRAPRR